MISYVDLRVPGFPKISRGPPVYFSLMERKNIQESKDPGVDPRGVANFKSDPKGSIRVRRIVMKS